jgi:hypothetical protein
MHPNENGSSNEGSMKSDRSGSTAKTLPNVVRFRKIEAQVWQLRVCQEVLTGK